ncbi:DUF4112 domain-containing protein [Planctomicrobium sp. SH668]|uniref:DUF4112 domain-containing protein n=1 Tax=Planctomicrobium sp. SH668 TaxID=3448126 RepID=UPI003F5C136B
METAAHLKMPEIIDSNSRNFDRAARPLTELEVLRRVRMIAELMDNRFVVPGTSIRVGFDALIGLVPVVGDFASAAVSAYIVYLAHQMSVPKYLLARMMFNIAVDFSAGAVPVVGDLIDVSWKANVKNVRILERHLLSRQK